MPKDQFHHRAIFGTEAAPVTLTDAFSGNEKVVDISDAEQGILFIDYLTGAGETNNTLQIKLEFSGDPSSSTFYQEVDEVVSTGVAVITPIVHELTGAAAATHYRAAIALPVAYRQVKISLKEGGVATNAGKAYIGVALTGE